MADYQIRWKRGDYITLGKAVAQFNKKINELNAEERKLYLPEIVNYNEAKSNITTRRELKRVINSLKRFSHEHAEDLYVTEGGERLTKWEYQELKNLQRSAKQHLNRELGTINKQAQPYVSQTEFEIRSNLNNIKKLDRATKSDFQRIKKRVNLIGSSDYEMKKARIWKENYMESIKRYEGYENYDKLMKKLKNYSNPISFYNLFKDNTNTVIEDYLFYISDQKIAQQQFNQLLSELGIDVESDLNIDSEEVI